MDKRNFEPSFQSPDQRQDQGAIHGARLQLLRGLEHIFSDFSNPFIDSRQWEAEELRIRKKWGDRIGASKSHSAAEQAEIRCHVDSDVLRGAYQMILTPQKTGYVTNPDLDGLKFIQESDEGDGRYNVSVEGDDRSSDLINEILRHLRSLGEESFIRRVTEARGKYGRGKPGREQKRLILEVIFNLLVEDNQTM